MPDTEGVYEYLDQNKRTLYVGKARNLKDRVSSYFTSPNSLEEKTAILVSKIEYIKFTKVSSELEALLLEAFLIRKLKPPYNIRLTDDKKYPIIQITIKDKYPAVFYSRQIGDKNSIYYGPYPDAISVRRVLKILRRAFKFKTTKNHSKRICLYYHLGLCLCPEHFNDPEIDRLYKKNIRNVVRVLEGESNKILLELTKERELYSENEEFEMAKIINDQIKSLNLIVASRTFKPFEYTTNPNLIEDIVKKDTDSLINTLNRYGVYIKDLKRIECYDISNLSGTNPVGSMVVFTNGQKDSSEYKRFRVKSMTTPNDFRMMEEVLTRRFSHEEWPKPSLIILDGGKGQVTSGVKILDQLKLTYPIIGIAKRRETIIIPTNEVINKFRQVRLSLNDPGLKLITRIRDEAHRFAITYHRKLRAKNNTYS